MHNLEEKAFASRAVLRDWLERNHDSSPGLLVRIYKKLGDQPSVTFEDVLEEGLCFGWSESQRLKGSNLYYLQRFTPRKTKGTTSERNKKLVTKLEKIGLMTDAGRAKL
ncbi:MAG: hypothetical protein WBO35_04750 [Candidatus Saccharimonadales bacterium]|jgi:uncharacterized protein YdeI (YjbR/CyaY-like superfamily)